MRTETTELITAHHVCAGAVEELALGGEDSPKMQYFKTGNLFMASTALRSAEVVFFDDHQIKSAADIALDMIELCEAAVLPVSRRALRNPIMVADFMALSHVKAVEPRVARHYGYYSGAHKIELNNQARFNRHFLAQQ